MTTGKTIALTTWTFVRKVMYLFFNTLSRFVVEKYYIHEGTDLRSPLTFSLLSSHSLRTLNSAQLQAVNLGTWTLESPQIFKGLLFVKYKVQCCNWMLKEMPGL